MKNECLSLVVLRLLALYLSLVEFSVKIVIRNFQNKQIFPQSRRITTLKKKRCCDFNGLWSLLFHGTEN